MNILLISFAKRALEPGSREQARMLKYAQKVDKLVVIVFTTAKAKLPEKFIDKNLHILGTHTRTKMGMFFKAIQLGLQMVREGRWIISSQDPYVTSFIGRYIAKRKKQIHHVQLHGDMSFPTHSLSHPRQWVRDLYAWHVLRTASRIRVVSNRVARKLEQHGIPSRTITVLPIQPQLDDFFEVPELQIKGTCTFTYIGRLAPEKNLPLLVRAFSDIDASSSVQLRLVGDGPERERIERLCRTLKIEARVTFIPWTNQIVNEYVKADVVLLASDHEGYALVLLEAMAAGRPVVTTDVGCAGEVMLNNMHGLVAPVGDEAAFSAQMQRLVKDPTLRLTFGQAGRRAAQQLVVPDDVYAEKWAASYRGL